MSNTFDFALLLNSYFPIKAMFRMMSPVIELSYYLKASNEFIGISPFRIINILTFKAFYICKYRYVVI